MADESDRDSDNARRTMFVSMQSPSVALVASPGETMQERHRKNRKRGASPKYMVRKEAIVQRNKTKNGERTERHPVPLYASYDNPSQTY